MVAKNNVVIFRELNLYSVGADYLLSNGYQVVSSKPKNHFKFIIKICKKLQIYLKCFFRLFWNIDSSILSGASLLILFDSSFEYFFCSCIDRFFRNKRHVVYYWNNIDNEKEKEVRFLKTLTKWDIFSFDLSDCKKYDLIHNKIFSPVSKNLFSANNFIVKQDVFFIGADKGRIDQILEIKHALDKMGVSNKLCCVSSNKSLKNNFYTEPMSYDMVLIEDMQSKAILDINYDDKFGMTMRELEALFLRKKLITNNQKVKERDFYNENNIFIIDYSKTDVFEGLKNFLGKPFSPIDKNIIESYSVTAWLNRFMI